MEQTINQNIGGDYPLDELEDGEVSIEFDQGIVKNVTINENDGSMSDVQAGIEFIYHMREHLVDIGIATVYAIVVYAIVLWITVKIKGRS